MHRAGYMRVGLLTFGLGLAEAASRAVYAPQVQKRLSLIGYYLYCHSIEQALKSGLKDSGISNQQLLNFGQDLKKAVDEAVANGVGDENLSPAVVECLGMLNAYYQENEFEYFSRAMGMRLPDTKQFAKVVRHLSGRLGSRYESDSEIERVSTSGDRHKRSGRSAKRGRNKRRR